MTRAKRVVTLIGVSGIGLAGIIALLRPASSAKLEGEIFTSYARFSTTRVTPLLGGIGVVSLKVEEVRLDDPAARLSAAARTWFDTTVEGGMSRVSQMQVPAEARVEIRSVPNTSILEVELRCPERCGGFRINNTGRHETSIPGSQPLRADTSQSYSLEPTAEWVSMVLKPADARPLLLAEAVPIGTLAFTDIEHSDNSVESSSRLIGSILGGKYRLPEYDSEWEDLQVGTWLSLALRDGTINRLEARGDTLRITFEARISSGTHGSASVVRTLIPTRIERYAHQPPPFVLLFTTIFAVGAFATLARDLLKWPRRGPGAREGLPGSEREP
jgi:hypothetical protein